MVLIELLVLKLALDGIVQHSKEEIHERDLQERRRYVRSQLAQLMIDYETGVIDQDTYNERESEILSNLK
jgi:hypothetical protein